MNEQCLEQAADWVDRINELSQGEFQQLLLWLDNPQNKKAFERMAQVFSDPAVKFALSEHSQNTTSVVSIGAKQDSTAAEETTLKKAHVESASFKPNSCKPSSYEPNDSKKTFGFPTLALAASFSAFALLMYWTLTPMQTPLSSPVAHTNISQPVQTLNSNIGERVSKLLKDGSYLHLNADSQLSAQLLTNTREVTLTKGQVFFDIAKDQTRPFIINSGQATIKVLGTSFDVERNDDSVVVTVYEGKVQVSANEQYILVPPQQAIVKNGNVTVLDNLQLDQLPLWRTGWLEVKEQPLVQVISQLQRYTDTPIKVNEQLSNNLISGRFKLTEPKQSLNLIASSYQWQVSEKLSGLYLTGL